MQPQTSDPLADGFALFKLGDLVSADFILQTIGDGAEDFSAAVHIRGLIAAKQGDSLRARRLLERAAAANPRDWVHPLAIANTPGATTTTAELEAFAATALANGPGETEVRKALPELAKRWPNFSEERVIRSSLRQSPYDPLLLELLLDNLECQCRYDEALEVCETLARIDANNSGWLVRSGIICMWQCRTNDAIHQYRRAVSRKPDNAYAHYLLGESYLMSGQYAEGWQEFEWRLKLRQSPLFPKADVPHWRGEALFGKSLLIELEQGIGDNIQFCRFLDRIPSEARVFVRIKSSRTMLHSVFGSLRRDVHLLKHDADIPDVDYMSSVLSLPLCLGIGSEGISGASYLEAPPESIAKWRNKMSKLDQLRVGLVWSGNPMNPVDYLRSIPIDQFSKIASAQGVDFVSLQLDTDLNKEMLNHSTIHDWTSEIMDMGDTAGLIENLDLVITVDTAVAHLAGALGCPVWMLNRTPPHWTWGVSGSKSVWYDSMTQYRQRTAGDWREPINEICNDIRTLVSKRTLGLPMVKLSERNAV